MNDKHTAQSELPDDLHETQHTLELLAATARASMPQALAEHLAASPPDAHRASRVVLGRITPMLAIAALIAVLATSIVFWQPSAPINTNAQDALLAVMQEDDLFVDIFDDAFDSFYTELVATEQLFASWDATALWDDSSSLWQEVVQ